MKIELIKQYLIDREGPKLWVALLIVLSTTYFSVTNGWWVELFWDNSVYARAVDDYLSGADAYRNEAAPFLPFVYHPYVLQAFATLHSVVPLWSGLVCAMFASATWTGYLLFRAAGLSIQEFMTAVAIAFTLKFFPLTSFASGNLVVTLDFLIFGTCLHSVMRREQYLGWATFVLIVLGALVKPYLLAYLGLALLDRRPPLQSTVLIVGGVALNILIWFSAYWILPDQMESLLRNLADLQSANRMDLGWSLFSVTYRLIGSNLASLSVHGAVMGALAVWSLRALLRAQDMGTARPITILVLGWMMLTLVNPRMKDYDIGPALVFLAPIVWLVAPRFRAITTGYVTALLGPLAIVVAATLIGVQL